MEQQTPRASIPESFLEHRQVFAEPWLALWSGPNPFIPALLSVLRTANVDLTDFSFNKDAANIGEVHLNIAIKRLNAAVRIGLDSVTFIAGNPYWNMAPQLVPLFESVSARIREIIQTEPKWQDATLTFHVTPGTADFKTSTASLLNQSLVGDSLFCGISLHRSDHTFIIDKSLRHEGAAFVRLQRRFAGDATFSDVASTLYEDELSALRLLGVTGVI